MRESRGSCHQREWSCCCNNALPSPPHPPLDTLTAFPCSPFQMSSQRAPSPPPPPHPPLVFIHALPLPPPLGLLNEVEWQLKDKHILWGLNTMWGVGPDLWHVVFPAADWNYDRPEVKALKRVWARSRPLCLCLCLPVVRSHIPMCLSAMVWEPTMQLSLSFIRMWL